jgi:hypothetical protein
MNNNISYPLVVENGFNTSYIDSLFMALFYKNTEYTNFILENIPKTPPSYYLQELIKSKFIRPIQRNYSINSNVINEIRNYSVICGWSKDKDITEQKNCIEFFEFLMNIFNIKPIELEILEFKNNVLTNFSQKILQSYIVLEPKKDDTIRNLLNTWINSKIYSPDESIIQCYKLNDIPQFITLYIDRTNKKYDDFDKNEDNIDYNLDYKIDYKIDIMKKIKFFGINDQTQNFIKWRIHSIICKNNKSDKSDKSDKSNKSGHYYSLLTTSDNKWLLFDDNNIPSINNINIDDDDIKEKIMSEVEILIYTLDN